MQTGLKRSLGLPMLTLYGLGNIVGAGIYVLVGEVAGIAGLYAPAAFLVATLLASFSGYSYAKLGARFPRSGGESVYLQQAFSINWLSTAIGWLVIASGIISSATLMRGCAGYINVFMSMPDLIAISIILLLATLVACWGIKESAGVAAVVTIIEIGGLLLVVWVLRDTFALLPTELPRLLPPLQAEVWVLISAGAFLAFYAFIGFEDMVNIAEEVRQPERNMPAAILAALVLASLLYALVAVVAVLSMPPGELAESSSPMATLLQGRIASAVPLVTAISLVAIINGALVQIIMGSRMLYGMSCQRLAPHFFVAIYPKTQTPIRATLLVALIVWLLAVIFPVVTLAKLTSFFILIVFVLVNAALMALQYRDAPYAIARQVIPALGLLSCTGLLALQLYFILTGSDALLHAGH